jgi:methionyl-tRNA formyltransferase
MSPLKIVFAGTPEFALPCLDALLRSHHHLEAVYTQPDRPAGRGRKLQFSAVKNWSLTHNLPVYQPVNFKDSASIDELAALQPDVMIVIAYGLILPKKILSIPRLGCINVHGSLLPRWRGASPIQQAIWHGDSQSGVTIMQMDAGMDTGDMLCEVPCSISPRETSGTLHDKLAEIAAEPLLATLEALASGRALPKVQDNNLATYAGKIYKEDAAINWHQSAVEIDRMIRAFTPWPIAFTHAGGEVLRIHQATLLTNATNKAPGTVIAINKTGLQVSTGHGVLNIERIQFSGGKIITITDWLNSGRSQLFVDQVLQ